MRWWRVEWNGGLAIEGAVELRRGSEKTARLLPVSACVHVTEPSFCLTIDSNVQACIGWMACWQYVSHSTSHLHVCLLANPPSVSLHVSCLIIPIYSPFYHVAPFTFGLQCDLDSFPARHSAHSHASSPHDLTTISQDTLHPPEALGSSYPSPCPARKMTSL